MSDTITPSHKTMNFTQMVMQLPIVKTKHTIQIGNWVYNTTHLFGRNRRTGEKWYGDLYTMLIEKKLIDVEEIIIKHYANTTTN